MVRTTRATVPADDAQRPGSCRVGSLSIEPLRIGVLGAQAGSSGCSTPTRPSWTTRRSRRSTARRSRRLHGPWNARAIATRKARAVREALRQQRCRSSRGSRRRREHLAGRGGGSCPARPAVPSAYVPCRDDRESARTSCPRFPGWRCAMTGPTIQTISVPRCPATCASFHDRRSPLDGAAGGV